MFTILDTMACEINEPITVGAVFSGGVVQPVWFAWRGRKVRITEIAFTWKTREGSAMVFHFSVTDGQGLYELGYHTTSFIWRLAAGEEHSAY